MRSCCAPASSRREALRRGPARPARRDAHRRHADRALPDRDQRARADPLPTRPNRLVRDRRRGGGRARRGLRDRRAGPGPARRPLRPAARARPARARARRGARRRRRAGRAGRARGGAHRLLGAGRLRDPADLVGAALDVAVAAARPRAAAPTRLRARLGADRADLHPRPAADRGARRRRLARERADRLRGQRHHRHDLVHRPGAQPRLRARPRGLREAASARSPRRACAR